MGQETTAESTDNSRKWTLPRARKSVPMELEDLGLNRRETIFVAAYCANGFNGRRAHKEAGYRAKNNAIRDSNASEILSRDRIQTAIRRYIDIVIRPYRDQLEYNLMSVYYKRAFYDVSTFFDDSGDPLPLSEIPEEWRHVIDGVETKYFGTSARQKVVDYKLASRDSALRTLYSILQGIKGEGSGGVELPSDRREKLQRIFSGTSSSSGVIDFPSAQNGGGA